MSESYCYICGATFRGDECPGCGWLAPDDDEPMTLTEEWARGEARSGLGRLVMTDDRPAAAPLDKLWDELLAQACSSDGPIRDNDVRQAIQFYRPRIEAEAARPTPQPSPSLDVEKRRNVGVFMYQHRMRTALLAFEEWARIVSPMLEAAGHEEAAAFGRDRVTQSEYARLAQEPEGT